MQQNQQGRRWVLTWNNYDDNSMGMLESYGCEYGVIGKELAPTTGMKHLQGYMRFKSSKKFETLHKRFPNVHWEKAIAKEELCVEYCKKDGDYIILGCGELSLGQGKRSDISIVTDCITEGSDLNEICCDHPEIYIKYHQGMEKLWHRMNPPKYRPEVEVYYYWGKTGVGKTRMVWEKEGGKLYFKDNTKWWNGYEGQEAVILDDFDASQWKICELKKILDRYPVRSESKGGYTAMNAKRIYITSDRRLEDWFGQGDDFDQVGQLVRRLREYKNIV